MLSTPSLKVAVFEFTAWIAPGFSSSLKISMTVGKPNCSSVNSLGEMPLKSASLAPITSLMQNTFNHRIGFGVNGRGVQRIDLNVIRIGIDAQKACRLFKVFSPRRGTFFSHWRLTNAPFASRYSTMFSPALYSVGRARATAPMRYSRPHHRVHAILSRHRVHVPIRADSRHADIAPRRWIWDQF